MWILMVPFSFFLLDFRWQIHQEKKIGFKKVSSTLIGQNMNFDGTLQGFLFLFFFLFLFLFLFLFFCFLVVSDHNIQHAFRLSRANPMINLSLPEKKRESHFCIFLYICCDYLTVILKITFSEFHTFLRPLKLSIIFAKTNWHIVVNFPEHFLQDSVFLGFARLY